MSTGFYQVLFNLKTSLGQVLGYWFSQSTRQVKSGLRTFFCSFYIFLFFFIFISMNRKEKKIDDIERLMGEEYIF